MFGIFKKDLAQYALLTALMLPMPLLLLHQDGLDRGAVMLFGYVAALSIITALMQNEAEESRSGGYRFLSTLPLSAREVVTAKYLLLAIFAAGHTLYAVTVVRLIAGPGVFFRLSAAYLICNGLFFLLLGAGLLWAVNRFRLPTLTRAVAGSATLALGLILAGEFVMLSGRTRGAFSTADLARFAEWVTLGRVTLALAAAAVLYWVIMRASIAAYQRKEF